jgi:hypothetical protein
VDQFEFLSLEGFVKILVKLADTLASAARATWEKENSMDQQGEKG